jgi:pyrophosphate--fructose-6-phosphate 1-phosphotransferase
VTLKEGELTHSAADQDKIKKLFPNTYGKPVVELIPGLAGNTEPMNVGVILSGGQAPGGHNVITGIFDELKKLNPENRLFGFLMGPAGFVKHNYRELTKEVVDEYRNTGGFDMIGSGRTKLETTRQFEKGMEIVRELNLKALIIIGGDDSNTNASVLAEYYEAKKYGVQVIGCPKTIDGDLKNEYIETSFGFDTATKTYSELIGNIERDCTSACKYWHFIKVMGRSASHIALECALQTRPNVCIISEEVREKDMSLNDIVEHIAEVAAKRAAKGMNYGVVIVPEGLIEFIPAIHRLIGELNDLLAEHGEEYKDLDAKERTDYILSHLSKECAKTFATLPSDVSRQLSLERDPHGNVQVSLIETEKLLAEMVKEKLKKWKRSHKFTGKFGYQLHFLGYEGRCGFPSNYDTNYCYALGATAVQLIANGKTGYMAVISNTTEPTEDWKAGGIPLTMLLNMEKRKGKMKPVILKTLVDLEGKPFLTFAAHRDEWAEDTCFAYPGPIQYFGPSEVCDQTTKTLRLEHEKEI